MAPRHNSTRLAHNQSSLSFCVETLRKVVHLFSARRVAAQSISTEIFFPAVPRRNGAPGIAQEKLARCHLIRAYFLRCMLVSLLLAFRSTSSLLLHSYCTTPRGSAVHRCSKLTLDVGALLHTSFH